ncbi:hypothetical protein MMC17_001011 [Xylographa soralifera]|nr:hypothetical protein [Xylographa soralifera]
MRSWAETIIRWEATFAHSSNLSDLKASVRDGTNENPCESGLRSICWKAFLLFENLDRSTWSKTLHDSRSAYSSLRDHFLHNIEHPDDLSAADPLADDDSSPWNTLRRDEILRDEIYQDVERCMPENLYFREPTTQTILLDILFIFCKLNADTGYRQGMHEVLAPILWVVSRDAVDPSTLPEQDSKTSESDDPVRQALDNSFIEHDAFTLFCIIMQTVKTFYEMGSTTHQTAAGVTSSSPIVERSKRIHEDYLRRVDPELTKHLTTIEILPQIFVIRWIRLLFGREFPFNDVLSLWDVLFAEDAALELVDFVCLAMLLRVRWQLLESDYSSALTILLRYPVPPSPNGPSTFVDDALYLKQHLTRDGGFNIISKYSGRSPVVQPKTPTGSYRRKRSNRTESPSLANTTRPFSPMRSPARFLQEQGGIEGILHEAAKGVYNKSEKWGVSKALLGAVQGLQSGSNSPRRLPGTDVRWSLDSGQALSLDNSELTLRIEALEQRNKVLAKMLEKAMEDLWAQEKLFDKEKQEDAANALTLAIAKVQFVQVYLEDSTMPLVPEAPPQEISESLESASEQVILDNDKTAAGAPDPQEESTSPSPATAATKTIKHEIKAIEAAEPHDDPPTPKTQSPISQPPNAPVSKKPPPMSKPPKNRPGPSPFHHPRPSLAQSSFSWILGEDQRKSSFVSASPFPPEEKRLNPARAKAGFLFGDDKQEARGSAEAKGKKGKDEKEDDDDGFRLGTLKGVPDHVGGI